MNRRHFRNPRRYPIPALAGLLTGACLASLAAQVSLFANTQPDPVTACTNLASLTKFPVTSTRITRAQFNPPGTLSATSILKGIYHMLRDGTKFQTASLRLPGHCQVQGIINERTGTDGFQYGDMFEVRLPTPADWNGRFMFQGPRVRYPRPREAERLLTVGRSQARTGDMRTAACPTPTLSTSNSRR